MQMTHVIPHEARCPRCGRLLKAPLPEKYRYGYGPRLTALIGKLWGSQRDSRSMVQEFCTSALGVPISRGAIQRAVDRVSDASQLHFEATAAKAQSATVNSIDETAWYQHGVLAWLWVMVCATVALFKVQASRNKATFAALIERWAGHLVSDGYAVYQHWVHGRQTCLAHLIRRALSLAERCNPELARSW
jgi:transposase